MSPKRKSPRKQTNNCLISPENSDRGGRRASSLRSTRIFESPIDHKSKQSENKQSESKGRSYVEQARRIKELKAEVEELKRVVRDQSELYRQA